MQLSVTSSGRGGGSEAFAPGPANPEIDTRQCRKESHSHLDTLRPAVHSARRVAARAWLVGWRLAQGLCPAGYAAHLVRPNALRLTEVITTGR